MASPSIFISHIHEDAHVAVAVQGLIENGLGVPRSVFLSSDPHAIYGGDDWLNRMKNALAGAPLFIALLSARAVSRPWVNFEAGAAWLSDKVILPCCVGSLSKEALPDPYSRSQAVKLPDDAEYLLLSVHSQLRLRTPPPTRLFTTRGEVGNQQQRPFPHSAADVDRTQGMSWAFAELLTVLDEYPG